MSEKKKVVILASFPAWILTNKVPNPGGHYATWLVALYEEFCRQEIPYEIHWISFHKGLREEIHFETHGQHFHFLPTGSLTIAHFSLYFLSALKVRQLLKKIKPDIIHSWGTETCYAWIARKLPMPKILSMQGMLTAYVQRANMPNYVKRQAFLERRTLKHFSLITAESEWGVERCRELAPDAEIQRWEYAANNKFYKTVRHLSKEPSCLIAGSDTHIKNVPCAIEAFSKPELRHIKLYMAGVERNAYSSLTDNIIPLGRVTHDTVAKLLSETWCLVHPSLADTCPNIVKEARVMGVPAIVTEECGAKQYIDNDKSGYIIRCRDAEALADSVLKVTESADHSVAMGAYDQERCRQLLSTETMYKELLQMYAKLMA